MSEANYLIDLSPSSAIVINDSDGVPIGLCKFLTDSPGILVFDRKGYLRCRIEFVPDGTPRVEMFDVKTGKAISEFLVSE